MEKTYLLRRGGAYLIDILIVTLFVYCISQIKFLNPQLNEYNNTFNEYSELYQNQKNSYELYQDQTYQNLTYMLAKTGMTTTIIDIFVTIGYFVVFQKLNKGQTVGKKLMYLKLEAKDGIPVSWEQISLRSVLIYYNIVPDILNVIMVLCASKMTFFYTNLISTLVFTSLFYISVLMAFFRKDNLGLHDILSQTKVIDLYPQKKA